MAKVFNELDERLREFIAQQKIFFVGSAPLNDEGLVNISPKGMDSLRILDPKTIAYIDFTGSGIETIAHVKENGRMVMMFCSFGSSPKILRLHGRGSVIERSDPEWPALQSHFRESRMVRAIIKLSIARIADSCGWGVPIYDYVGERDQYQKYAEQTDDAGVRKEQLDSNMESIEGLPGLEAPAI